MERRNELAKLANTVAKVIGASVPAIGVAGAAAADVATPAPALTNSFSHRVNALRQLVEKEKIAAETLAFHGSNTLEYGSRVKAPWYNFSSFLNELVLGGKG